MTQPRQIVPGRVYLVTRRCTQRQFLLRPDDETNNAFIYCFAYAASRTGVEAVAFIANSNHYHAVVVDVEGRLPEFLETFHKLLAKHQNCIRGRWENMWSAQHTSAVELVNPEDVLAKVVYTLTNPVKDHLVERAHHWPGATSLRATVKGGALHATRPRRFFRADGSMPARIDIRCRRAPGFEGLSDDVYGETIEGAIASTEAAAATERRATGRRLLGRKAVLAQNPFDSPSSREPRRVLNPQVAAVDKGARVEAILRRKAFKGEYGRVRPLWSRGEDVVFPIGTWWLRRHCGAIVRIAEPG